MVLSEKSPEKCNTSTKYPVECECSISLSYYIKPTDIGLQYTITHYNLNIPQCIACTEEISMPQGPWLSQYWE